MSLQADHRIGKQAMLLLLSEDESYIPDDWISCTGKVGTMDSQKIVAAIETAAKNNGIINGDIYRETHALYHAIIEALHGITRGQLSIGSVLRTVGLRFSIIRGNPYEKQQEGEWIAVALYGTIGAPIKGLEHETMGLGINHI
ncbi:hut operon transcriptional regulator HutP [Chengkuizengella axinellae]|uniref:Hut operon positive regulatory protein n=1 Tax=Chengkuizengella axinellae TaxID=3064388 RepID=A0ABT9J305_9BACL|nr:hut operon transcriptional regulator HutP [Chengkuizengella sp. 2205SS18-9]MDP5275960.1 hut operon transcriptional regulator HutP [Chengkuizengella sp. 2205SS18-9]